MPWFLYIFSLCLHGCQCLCVRVRERLCEGFDYCMNPMSALMCVFLYLWVCLPLFFAPPAFPLIGLQRGSKLAGGWPADNTDDPSLPQTLWEGTGTCPPLPFNHLSIYKIPPSLNSSPSTERLYYLGHLLLDVSPFLCFLIASYALICYPPPPTSTHLHTFVPQFLPICSLIKTPSVLRCLLAVCLSLLAEHSVGAFDKALFSF